MPASAIDRPDHPEERPEVRKTRVWLCVFYALNVLFLYLVAISRSSFSGMTGAGLFDSLQLRSLIIAESMVLLLPGLVAGLLVARISLLATRVVGGSAMAIVLPLYFVDYMTHRSFNLRLIEPRTWDLVVPVLARGGEFTLQTSWFMLIAPVGVYIVVEVVCVVMAHWVSARASQRSRSFLWAGLVATTPVLLAATLKIFTAPDPAFPFRPTKDPHPIHLTGLFEKTKRDPRSMSPLENRCAAQLVMAHARWEDVDERYRDLEVIAPPPAQPDVVLFIIESLRHDAVSAPAAPHLTALARESVVPQAHYSSGNATPFGYFGIMYGLNMMWYPRALETGLPPALPQLLKQLGYHRAFLGSWAIDGWSGMHCFLNNQYFDRFQILPLGNSFADGDRSVVNLAGEMLERQGEYRGLRDTPLFLVLQLNSTHFEYHSEPVDEVFTPSAVRLPPFDMAERQLVVNRYLNSVRCIDRLIAPLLDRRRVLVVAGDHGQSLGEDGFFLHGSAFTRMQLQTPFLFYAPGIVPRQLHRPTSHVDLIPTLLDALGARLNEPRVLHGTSLLDSEAAGLEDTVVVGGNSRAKWAIFSTKPQGADPALWYHLDGDPFSAVLRIAGVASSSDGEIRADTVEEEPFRSVYQRLIDRMCGWSSPVLPQDACVSLLESAQSGDVASRILAIRRLSDMGPAAISAVPALRRLLEDEHPQVRSAATDALYAINTYQ